jgi:hypothetical protein
MEQIKISIPQQKNSKLNFQKLTVTTIATKLT